MRKFFYFFSVLISSLFVSSCVEEFDDSAIWEELEGLKTRITALEEKVADNVSALQSMVSLGSIASYDYNAETGKGVITLVDGKKITIDQTVTGQTLMTVTKGDDGVWYWAICKDGVSTPLIVNGKNVPISITPALKISDENEWLISVDGGMTWVNTGIEYGGAAVKDESGDSDDSEEGSSGLSEIVFFKKAEKDGEYLTLTLADDSVIKVAIAGESKFAATSDVLYFSRISMTKSLALEMVNVSAYTITEVPEGWKANIEGEYLNVTSPKDFTTFPKSGTIKALAVYENGLPAILSLEVVVEPMVSLKYVNGKVIVTLSENTGEDFNGYFIGGCPRSDFNNESVAMWFNTEAANLEMHEGSAEFALSDIFDDFDPESEYDYMVYAVPCLPLIQISEGNMSYDRSDVQSVVCRPASMFTFSDVKFDSATLDAKMRDDAYYGGVFTMENWTNYGKDNLLESLQKNNMTPYTIQSYNGPANAFPDGQAGVKILPATEYVVWYLPVNDEDKYTEEDIILNTFTTPDVTADASIAAPRTSVTSVSISGFTAEVTPASGTYRTYAAAVKSSAIPANDAELVKYLVSSGKYSEGNAVNTVTTSSVSSEDEVYLVAVSLSAAGGYGAIVKEKVDITPVVFTDALSVKVESIEYGISDVTLSLSFTGNPATITYYANTYTYYEGDVMRGLLALGQYGDATTVKISSLSGSLHLTNIIPGAEYTFYAVVNDGADKASQLYTYTFTLPGSIDYITSSAADYDYGKPSLSGTYTSGNNYTLTLNVNKPSSCTKYWLFRGNYEFFTGDPYGDSDKLVTRQFMDVTEHTASETGLVYEFMNSTSRIYMVWLDDQGRYHAIYEYNPKAK